MTRALFKPRSRGVALLMVLWIVMISGLMLLGVMQAARMQAAISHGDLAAVQAHWLARAGVEQAMAVLEDDDPAVDSELDKWYRNDELFSNVSLGNGTFTISSADEDHRAGLDDESARINLNVADRNQLKAMKSLSDQQISALIAWRTPLPDAAQSSSVGQGGAGQRRAAAGIAGGGGNAPDGGPYAQLRFPYEMRHKDFQTHRELLLVQGFEDRKFFGDSRVDLGATGPAAETTVYSYTRTTDAKGDPRVNLNTATAKDLQDRFNFTPQLAQGLVQARQPQFQNYDAVLNVKPAQNVAPGDSSSSANGGEPPVAQMSLQWLASHSEQITLNDGGQKQPAKININTASRDVLKTLPGLTDDIADRIIAGRGAAGGEYKTLGDVLDRHTVDENAFRRFFDRLTVRSDVFSVQSTGISAGGMSRKIFAVIDRGQTPFRILYWYQT